MKYQKKKKTVTPIIFLLPLTLACNIRVSVILMCLLNSHTPEYSKISFNIYKVEHILKSVRFIVDYAHNNLKDSRIAYCNFYTCTLYFSL